MASDRIESVIDLQKVQAEIDATEKGVKDLVALIQSVKGTSLGVAGSTSLKEYQALKRELDLLIKQTDAATKAAIGEAKARQAAAKAAGEEAKSSAAAAKAKQAETKETERSAKAKAAEQKLIEQATDDYLQLSKAYNEAALRAKNYVLRLGEAHPIAVEAINDANNLGNVLKKLDASVGQNQRNVGNYKSAFDGLGFSFTQVARELPSLAINFQTFALAISNNLPMVADQIAQAKNEIAALKAEGKDTPSLFQRLGKSLFSFQVGLSVLITVFTVFSGSIINFIQGLFGVNQNLEESTRLLEKYSKAVDDGKKSTEALIGEVEKLNRLGKINLEFSGLEGADLIDLQAQFIGTQETLFKLNEERKAGIAIDQQAFKDRMAGIITEKDYLATIEKTGKRRSEIDAALIKTTDEQKVIAAQQRSLRRKQAQDAIDEAKKLAEQRRRALFEIAKLEQEQIAEAAKIIFEDETKSYLSRLQALKTYTVAKDKIVSLTANFEKGKEGLVAAEIRLIDKQAKDARIKLARETQTELSKIEFEERVKLAEKATAEEFVVYDKLYNDLTDRVKRYEKEKDRLDKERKDKDKKNAEERKKLEQQLISELTTLAFTVFTAGIEREKNAIQEQIDLLEQKKQKDIEVANATITNTQDRAAAIQIIEARAAAQKEQLVQKQRQLDIRKAQFDKAQSIARIIQETAQGVIKFTASGNPVLAALVAAIGAVQLATVLAQPIPRYKGGTDDHKGGLMIVGDGGKSEGITLPDGTVLKSPATDTLMSAPAGTKVHPDYDQMMMSATMTKVPTFSQRSTTDTSTPKILNGLNKVEKAIKKIPQPITQVENVLSRKIRKGGSVTQRV